MTERETAHVPCKDIRSPEWLAGYAAAVDECAEICGALATIAYSKADDASGDSLANARYLIQALKDNIK